MTTPTQTPTPSVPHSLTTHIVKAHVVFFDSSKHRFCSANDYPQLPGTDAVLVTKALSTAGVNNDADLKATKASGYIATLGSAKQIGAPHSEGSDAAQVAIPAAPYTDWSLTTSTTYALPTDEKLWETARDAIKALHRALKGLFVPAVYSGINEYRRGKELQSTKTIHYNNKVWYPVSDLLTLYDTLLAKSKVGEDWQLVPKGVLAGNTVNLEAYIAVDQTPLGSMTSATTFDNRVISDPKGMKEHYGHPSTKPPATNAPASALAEKLKDTPKTANVTGTPTWADHISPFGNSDQTLVWGAPVCTVYLEKVLVMWWTRDGDNAGPLYFGIFGGDPNNGGDGVILGPTPVVNAQSGGAIASHFTPALATLDDEVHLIITLVTGRGGHFIFNNDLTTPGWVLVDVDPSLGPMVASPALSLLDNAGLMCVWLNSSWELNWTVWEPASIPPNPKSDNPSEVPTGKWIPGKVSVRYQDSFGHTVVIQTKQPPALLQLKGQLILSYIDQGPVVQLLAFGTVNSIWWSPVTPGLNGNDLTVTSSVGAGYDSEYAVIADRAINEQKIGVSVYRKGTWDARDGLSEASQDEVCAAIVNRCAYIFFESTAGAHRAPQYGLICTYLDLSSIQYHPSSWMKDLTTDRSLTAMAIPGTHDTTTYNAPFYYKWFGIDTQAMDVQTQLHSGIRAFDFRLEIKNDELIFVHNGWDVDLDFSDAMDTIYTFITAQPQEVLLICMLNDSDGLNTDEEVMEWVTSYIAFAQKDSTHWYFYGGNREGARINDLPSLNTARGQIVLLRRFAFNLPPIFGVDFSQYSGQTGSYVGGRFTIKGGLPGQAPLGVQVQDIYSIGLGYGSLIWPLGTPVPDYDTKFGYVKNFLQNSAADKANLIVNYTSAACDFGGTGYPPPAGWSPDDLAQGMWTWSISKGYTEYTGINGMFQEFLDDNPTVIPHGLIYMDYPETPDDLIDSIIELNTFN